MCGLNLFQSIFFRIFDGSTNVISIFTIDNQKPVIDYLDTEYRYEVSERKIKDKAFFLSHFEQLIEPAYLSDKQATNIESACLGLTINSDDSFKIKVFCQSNNISPYTLFMGVLAIYIFRIKGAMDFYLGTAVLNRAGKIEKKAAGMLINTVAVPIHIDDTKSSLKNLMETANMLSSIFRHQKYQYIDLLKDIREKYGFTDRLAGA